jgi:threonine synthase
MSLWRWSKFLPEVPSAYRLDIGTGQTPLIRSLRIGPSAGLPNLWFKLETANPTGSYKDRFGAVAISHMAANGRNRCVGTSSGNSGAALAAHCAAAGIRCEIATIITAPGSKVDQMRIYGARVYKVDAFGLDPKVTHDTFEHLKEMGNAPDATLQISAYCYSPTGMEGVKTISYELKEQMPAPCHHVFVPAGGGGLALAVTRGFEDLVEAGTLNTMPRMQIIQPDGNDTIATPLNEGAAEARSITQSTSRISGLQCPSILDGHDLIQAARRSSGSGHLVGNEAVWEMQQRLAFEEGVFCEPAGAVATAGAVLAGREGRIDKDENVVCLVTGSGFKDEPSARRIAERTECPTITFEQLRRSH